MESRKQQIIELLQANRKDPFLLFALAKEYENENNQEQARLCYQDLFENHDTYIGLYYHYGKLLEKLELNEQAIGIYKIGITKAKEINDLHSLAELQSALMNLEIE